MYASLKNWPSPSNPGCFIPVIIEYFPFELYDSTIVFNNQLEYCPNCKHYYDKHVIYEGDNKYKCNWCQKNFKVTPEIQHQIDASSPLHYILLPETKSKSIPNYFSSEFISQLNTNSSVLKRTPTYLLLYREPIGRSFPDHQKSPDSSILCYTLFFVIDATTLPDQLEQTKQYLFIAIDSLTSNQSFVLVVIYSKYVSYVFTLHDGSNTLFSFNISLKADQKIYNNIDIQQPANFKAQIETLKKYISRIRTNRIAESKPMSPQKEGFNPINQFLDQITGDKFLFSQVVLFSPICPTIQLDNHIIVNMISPDKIVTSQIPISGFYLNADIPDLDNQIRAMIQSICNDPIIFNVELTAHVSNYKMIQHNPNLPFCPFGALDSQIQGSPLFSPSLVSQMSLSYPSANCHFSAVFQLFPDSKSAVTSSNISYFGVEMTYVRFYRGYVYNETIWASRDFRWSSDFIPVISTINPFMLIPFLCSESVIKLNTLSKEDESTKNGHKKFFQSKQMNHSNEAKKSTLESFVSKLLLQYKYYCLGSLAGNFDDYTFSTIPDLQWFLRVLFEPLHNYKSIHDICFNSFKNDSNFSNSEDKDFDYDFTLMTNHKMFMLNQYMPISCNLKERFSRYYPYISFWADQNTKLIHDCPLDQHLYQMAGSPPIVVIDAILFIFVFVDQQQCKIDWEQSKFGKSLLELNEYRFPKAKVEIRPISELSKIFLEKNKLFSIVHTYFKSLQAKNSP